MKLWFKIQNKQSRIKIEKNLNFNEKMTESLLYNPCVYQTPSEKVLENRKLFYLTHKDDTESITEWLWRIKDCIIGCEFGELSDFLLIDKFICELRNDEIQNFTRIQTWELEQLCEAVEGPKFDPDVCTIDASNNQETNINAILQCEVKMVGVMELEYPRHSG